MGYSKRAVHFCVLSLVIAGIFVILSQIERSPHWNIDVYTEYLITLQYMSIFIGFAISMVALPEKGKNTKQKYAIGINVFLFMILIVFFICQNF